MLPSLLLLRRVWPPLASLSSGCRSLQRAAGSIATNSPAEAGTAALD